MSTSNAEPVEPSSYEAARRELAAVLEKLERGAPTLEESLALWERGEHLATVCQQWLDGAKARLDAAAPGGAAGSSASAADAPF